MASYIPASGNWPDPRKDTLIYVVNPIEAGLPGHWMPISVIKKHIEMRVDGRTALPILTKYSKSTRSKIKLFATLTTRHFKNKQKNDFSDANRDKEDSIDKAFTYASNPIPSDETDALIEAKAQTDYSDSISEINEKAIKASTASVDKKTAVVANTTVVIGRYTRAPATLKPLDKPKQLKAPHSSTTDAPNQPPTERPTAPLSEAPTETTTELTTTPTGDPFY